MSERGRVCVVASFAAPLRVWAAGALTVSVEQLGGARVRRCGEAEKDAQLTLVVCV